MWGMKSQCKVIRQKKCGQSQQGWLTGFTASTDVIKATLLHVETFHKAKIHYRLSLPQGRESTDVHKVYD